MAEIRDRAVYAVGGNRFERLSGASIAGFKWMHGPRPPRSTANGHSGAAVVSFVTAIEILLKATSQSLRVAFGAAEQPPS